MYFQIIKNMQGSITSKITHCLSYYHLKKKPGGIEVTPPGWLLEANRLGLVRGGCAAHIDTQRSHTICITAAHVAAVDEVDTYNFLHILLVTNNDLECLEQVRGLWICYSVHVAPAIIEYDVCRHQVWKYDSWDFQA